MPDNRPISFTAAPALRSGPSSLLYIAYFEIKGQDRAALKDVFSARLHPARR
jgi:hypothetical protein